MYRFHATALLGAIALWQGYLEAIAQDLDYVIVNEQIDPIPLPFQAAVFRRAFQNRTDHVLTPYPEHGAVILKIRSEEASEYRTARGGISGGGRDTPGYLGPRRTQLVPLTLEPETQSTIRRSFVAEWFGMDAGAVLFPEAGTYSFKLYYDDELRIVVHEPQGDDKLIVDQLRANPDLAAAMMSPVLRPPEELQRSLRRIVKLYPESSYADYARYALARHYAGPTLGGDLRKVSDDHKISVDQLLHDIDASFAYAPDALVLRHQVLKSQRRDDVAARVMATLRKDFSDSSEFLDYLASQLSDEEWTEQNPRAPTRIPDAAEEPPPNGRP